ncbi:hypothetical protein SF123566_2777, partial [Shigella flexneri 1235-66]
MRLTLNILPVQPLAMIFPLQDSHSNIFPLDN